jgi:YebC/PmpR family DNA-binding regulatory protein
MAGHSKWANIKIRKGAQDAKKGKAFTRVAKEIMLAAKTGGGDVTGNPRLRTALLKAREVNLPKDKIETAIKKGTGELQAEIIDEMLYEGYGPGGVAIMIEAATDNKNRTVAEMRHILSKHGGALGETGSVGWIFSKKGVLVFPKELGEDKIMEVGLEAGVEDVVDDGDYYEVRTAVEDFYTAKQAFDNAGMKYESAELAMIPSTTVPLDVEGGRKVLKVTELLEENDDVQNVYTNADFPDELMAELEG